MCNTIISLSLPLIVTITSQSGRKSPSYHMHSFLTDETPAKQDAEKRNSHSNRAKHTPTPRPNKREEQYIEEPARVHNTAHRASETRRKRQLNTQRRRATREVTRRRLSLPNYPPIPRHQQRVRWQRENHNKRHDSKTELVTNKRATTTLPDTDRCRTC